MSDIETSYREDSIVAKKKTLIDALVQSHWSYMENVIIAGIDVTRMYTFEEVMEMREWDYTSAFIHGYGHGAEDASKDTDITMAQCITRQRDWALKTFGPGDHSEGLLKHIKKEVIEIMEDTSETEEWVDIIILAIEGAWRTGASPKEVVQWFDMKMSKNERRQWPDIGELSTGVPIEHLKGCEKEIVKIVL